MRGSWSPASISTIRVVPSVERMVTRAGMAAGYSADDLRIPSQRVLAHCAQHLISDGGFYDRHQLTLVGDVQGIESQHLARALYFRSNRNGSFFQLNPDTRLGGNLVQGAGNTSARRITHAADFSRYRQHGSDERMQCSAIAGQRGLELQALALRHDADAVLADGAAEQDPVSRPRLIGGKFNAFRHDAYAGGIDEQPIGASFLDHLGIAGDDLHVGGGCRLAQGIDHAAQRVHRQSFLDDESGTEIERLCAAHGKVVHRPVYGQRADIAAGKEQRLDDE